MFPSARKVLVGIAFFGATALPLTACSSSDTGTDRSEGNGQPLLQIPDENGQYSAQQDEEYRAATGKSGNETALSEPEPVISTSVEKTFSVPEDISPGVYVFEPDYSGDGLLYASYDYGELPKIVYAPADPVVFELTSAAGAFSIAGGEVYVATPEQIATLPHADIGEEEN